MRAWAGCLTSRGRALPSYYFECFAGHLTVKGYRVSDCPKSVRCNECSRRARKILAPVQLCVPQHMTAEHDRNHGVGIAKHRESLKSPEVRKKIMDGEYAFEKD